MSLQYELSTLTEEPLVATFDARVAGAQDADVDDSLRQMETRPALLALLDHAAATYARENWVGTTCTGESAKDLEMRGFRTGAMAMLVTLIQAGENQALAEQLGL